MELNFFNLAVASLFAILVETAGNVNAATIPIIPSVIKTSAKVKAFIFKEILLIY